MGTVLRVCSDSDLKPNYVRIAWDLEAKILTQYSIENVVVIFSFFKNYVPSIIDKLRKRIIMMKLIAILKQISSLQIISPLHAFHCILFQTTLEEAQLWILLTTVHVILQF